MGVRQAANIKHQISLARNPLLEAKRLQNECESIGLLFEKLMNPCAQGMRWQIAGIDAVGLLTQWVKQTAFTLDGLNDGGRLILLRTDSGR